MSFLTKKRVLIIKAEAAPGVAETLTTADYDIRFEEPKYTPKLEFDTSKKVATPDYGEYEDVPGAQAGEISASFKFCPGTDVNAAAHIDKALKMAGLVGESVGATGYIWNNLPTGDEQTYTAWMMDVASGGTPVGIVHKIAGCVADLDIEAAGAGKPIIGTIKMTGKNVVAEDLTAGNMLILATMTTPDSTPAYIFLNAPVTSISNTFKCSKFKLSCGNTVSPLINSGDATSYDYFTITNRQPKLSINPLKQAKSVYDAYARASAVTNETIGITLTGPTFPLLFQVPNAQLLLPKEGEREGRINWELDFKCMRNGYEGAKMINGADVACLFRIIQGTLA